MSDPFSLILLVVAGGLLIFMMINSRKRMAKMREEQEAKRLRMVPGAEVMLQGGIYGTVVEYDQENLDRPAVIEIAPGTTIKVHSQAILKLVEDDVVPTETLAEAPGIEMIDTPKDNVDSVEGVETIEETRRRLDNNGKSQD